MPITTVIDPAETLLARLQELSAEEMRLFMEQLSDEELAGLLEIYQEDERLNGG